MVISSVNKKGNPESSIVGFGQNSDLELIFGTDMTTRKVKNITQNSRVSIVVNGSESAIQYEGKAQLLNGKKLEDFQGIFYKKVPGLRKYSLISSQIYYKIVPTWIRYIDHTTSPGTITEIKF